MNGRTDPNLMIIKGRPFREAFLDAGCSFSWGFMSPQFLGLAVLLLGESTVGKTQLLNKYISGINKPPGPTIGVEFGSKQEVLKDRGKSTPYKLQVWDTAGQERYRSMTRVYEPLCLKRDLLLFSL
jgi:predicted GTPase